MNSAAEKPMKAPLPPNAFIGQKEQPTEADLAAALGDAKPVWDRLVSMLIADCPQLVSEWKFYSLKMGWGFRLQHKKRNIVHLGPSIGGFLVMLVFGDKGFNAVREAALPERFREIVANAPKYPEGNGIRFQVKKSDIPVIRKLAKIKREN